MSIQWEKIIPYDIEVFPNIFTFTAYSKHHDSLMKWELSWRKNMLGSLMEWLEFWRQNGFKMVGYNNLNYDYPVLHEIITNIHCRSCSAIFDKSTTVINTPWNSRWDNQIDPYNQFVPQIDLMTIHHHDMKGVSLKELEFKMKLGNISDMPFPVGVPIPETDEAAEILLSYNGDDVIATRDFAYKSEKDILLRNKLSAKYNADFTNLSESSIGKKVVTEELKARNVPLWQNGRRVQTHRSSIPLSDVIFDYITFDSPEFKDVHKTFMNTVVDGTKGSFKNEVEIHGVHYTFALGGLHASVKNKTFKKQDGWIIRDADATSFYPLTGVINQIAPAHIPVDTFCDTVYGLFLERTKFPKKTHPTENYAIKIVINAIYGLSNNEHSPILDALYTMQITVNGQLLLCMLIEQLYKIPSLHLIQANTDGITVRFKEEYEDQFNAVCEWWQSYTQHNLEYADYQLMAVRDVNNYIAISGDDIKRKGAYNYEGLSWDKSHDFLVIRKAASAAIIENVSVRKFIMNHDDPFDFVGLIKVGKKDGLHNYNDIYIEDSLVYQNVKLSDVQKTSRYYVSNDGDRLVITRPPLKRRTNNVRMVFPGWVSRKVSGCNKNLTVESQIEYDMAVKAGYVSADGGNYTTGPVREEFVQKGYLQTIANVMPESIDDMDINYEWYIREAEKLVDGVKTYE